jgi:N-acetylmuramoyl-L-alanine amidase
MRINHGILVDDPRIQTYAPAPRGWISSIKIKPDFCVIHETATISLADAFLSKWYAHIYIDDDGLIYQKVPLDCYACHAGVSEWGGRNNLNAFSHGIENRKFGYLLKDWKGRFTRDGKYIPAERVIDCPHRLEKKYRYFEDFTDPQIASNYDVVNCLNRYYHYVDIVGHDDVAAKLDPESAFALKEFKELFYGPEIDSLFMISRWWPGNDIGAGGVSLKWLPYDWAASKLWLPAGSVVRKKEWSGRWVKVERDDGKNGWTHEAWLRRILQ